MNKRITLILLFFIFSIWNITISAQISVTSITPNSAVQNVLIGVGVTASNIQYHGSNAAIGKFTSTSASLPFSSGIILSTGLATAVSGNATSFASTDNSQGSDPQLAAIADAVVKDASVLEFDFIPESDTVRFRYIFASEEYPNFVGFGVNDIFGFFISGINPAGGSYTNKNIALIPGTNTPVAIDNINDHTNTSYYINNASSSSLVFGGKTIILTAWARVTPCTQYHIKLAIGDVGDAVYDSGVFLEANSFSSPRVTISPNFQTEISPGNAIEGCSDANLKIKLPFTPTSDYWLDYQVTGTATRNTDYILTPSNYDYIIVPANQDSTFINIHPIMDNISEGIENIKFIIKTSICYDIFDTVTINIINRDSLKLTLVGDTLVCDGDSANLTATLIDGFLPHQFTWSNGATNLSQTLMPVDSISTFIINATDICNDSESDTITVIKSYINISVRPDTTICEGNDVLLFGSGPGELFWVDLTGQAPIVQPTETTKYFASITNNCGTARDTVTVYVDTIPHFSLGLDTLVCEQNPISIGVPNQNLDYYWSNGNLNSYITIDQSNTYALTIINGQCSYSDSIFVAQGFCDWWIANSFSPNKDGLNDSFKPVGAAIPNYKMIIFNRWGEQIFVTSDWNIGWDGKYGSQRVEFGVYFYQIWGATTGSNEQILLKYDRVTLF